MAAFVSLAIGPLRRQSDVAGLPVDLGGRPVSRFSPALDARISYRGDDVVRTLDRVCAEIGYPKTSRVDQGSEFISRDLDLWAYAKGVTLDFSRSGKPTDNAFALRQGH